MFFKQFLHYNLLKKNIWKIIITLKIYIYLYFINNNKLNKKAKKKI